MTALGMRLGPTRARRLGVESRPVIAGLLDADPIASCAVAERFEHSGGGRGLGGEFIGVAGGRSGLCLAGSNVLPIAGDTRGMAAIGSLLARTQRRASSVAGRARLVLPLWSRLAPAWGDAREVRPDQPLMVCPDPPAVAEDRRVVAVRTDQIDTYFPAAVSMFSEEIGIDPTSHDGGRGYRARIRAQVEMGRAFALIEDGMVVYKAEVGALSSRVGLIQGVWVHPERRGRGIAAAATATVVAQIQRWGRLPSLYVNSFNTAARATYRTVGFHQVGTFATVLL